MLQDQTKLTHSVAEQFDNEENHAVSYELKCPKAIFENYVLVTSNFSSYKTELIHVEQKLKEWPDILFKNKEINLKHERVNKVKIELNRFGSKRKDIMIDYQ